MNNRVAMAVLVSGSIALVACGKKDAPDQLPPVGGEETVDTGTQGPATSGAPVVGSQEHFENAVNGQNVIYFDTDRYNVDSTDAAILQAQAQYLQRYPQITVTIEGHADERGTREYNLALGERRANSAKNYLVSLGVAANRMRTVSYGKERPVALASNESAWAQNRRAASVVIN
ncbi:peptidoglycan-associated lipoprotein Pal [Qipengyuania sp. JC766]|uniref:peptidoglycan-associated lipoprotein Pal n=1 Tax=Qipengyuania sp. JC766 TaxID=3232139 RepID=UPI00345A8F2C